jgi:hypothetical protein
MNGARLESSSESYEGVEGRPIQLSGERVEAVLGRIKEVVPGVELEGMDVQMVEDAALAAGRRAFQAETRQQESNLQEQADAWRSLLSFMRPNNSIAGINHDPTGRPIGLNIVVKELPKK